MNKQSIIRIFIAFAASLLFAGTVNASGIGFGPAASIFLNHSDENELLPNGTNYLQVDIWNNTNGAIDFVIRPLEPLVKLVEEYSLTNYGIDSFAFNFGSSGASIENIVLANHSWGISNEKLLNGFGEFDVILTGGEFKKQELQFSIIGVEGDTAQDYLTALSRGDAPNGNFLMGAGLTTDIQEGLNIDRARFAGGSAAVPIPAAVWLLASGLSFLFFFGRRSAKARS